jgi:hypothetical protein
MLCHTVASWKPPLAAVPCYAMLPECASLARRTARLLNPKSIRPHTAHTCYMRNSWNAWDLLGAARQHCLPCSARSQSVSGAVCWPQSCSSPALCPCTAAISISSTGTYAAHLWVLPQSYITFDTLSGGQVAFQRCALLSSCHLLPALRRASCQHMWQMLNTEALQNYNRLCTSYST